MSYKRILTIQDISCVGQCSLTVALPVLSACGHETCVLPTALLSTHTGGFGKPAIASLSDALPEIAAHWKENGITFDVILTGYLGSAAAIHTAMDIMDTMLSPGAMPNISRASLGITIWPFSPTRLIPTNFEGFLSLLIHFLPCHTFHTYCRELYSASAAVSSPLCQKSPLSLKALTFPGKKGIIRR